MQGSLKTKVFPLQKALHAVGHTPHRVEHIVGVLRKHSEVLSHEQALASRLFNLYVLYCMDAGIELPAMALSSEFTDNKAVMAFVDAMTCGRLMPNGVLSQCINAPGIEQFWIENSNGHEREPRLQHDSDVLKSAAVMWCGACKRHCSSTHRNYGLPMRVKGNIFAALLRLENLSKGLKGPELLRFLDALVDSVFGITMVQVKDKDGVFTSETTAKVYPEAVAERLARPDAVQIVQHYQEVVWGEDGLQGEGTWAQFAERMAGLGSRCLFAMRTLLKEREVWLLEDGAPAAVPKSLLSKERSPTDIEEGDVDADLNGGAEAVSDAMEDQEGKLNITCPALP